jgi:hypothetical protein
VLKERVKNLNLENLESLSLEERVPKERVLKENLESLNLEERVKSLSQENLKERVLEELMYLKLLKN